jgi:excisionase family DNA binding protein
VNLLLDTQIVVDDDRRAAIDASVQRALGRFADRATIDCPELAELLNVSRATGYELVKRGTVPSISCGNRVVVPVPGLVAVLLGADVRAVERE